MSERRPARGWEPYLVPYAAFLAIGEIYRRLPDPLQAWGPPLRVVVTLALFLHYARRRRAFPELRGAPRGALGIAADAALGLGVAALWVTPYLAGWLPTPEQRFDPNAMGVELRALRLALRAIGFALITPFVEELFVRSFLMRSAELVSLSRHGLEIDDRRDFRDLPVARYTAWSFWITVLYFAFSHMSWELPVAFATGIVYNLWLYRRGHILPVIRAHAVTNAAIFALVIAADRYGGDLWYLL